MRFTLGRESQLDVTIEYADPYSVDPLLTDSLVLPVELTVQNVSSRSVAFNVRDLRLNVGSGEALAPVGPGAAAEAVYTSRRVPSVLRFLNDNFNAFLPTRIEAVLENRQMKDGDIAPGRSKSGLVFFLRPAGSNPLAQTGVMWLEAKDAQPQMLETKQVGVSTRTPGKPSFTERFKGALSTLFGPALPFGKSYALVIGIGNYQNLPPLAWTASDVKKMKAYLEEQGFDEVVTPTEDSITVDKLKQPQKYFTNKLGPNDRFLIYYSGHGMQDGDKGYLPLKNEVAGGHQQSIPMESLVTWMKGLKVDHLLVILDTCFSGLAAGADEEKSVWSDAKLDRESILRLGGPARYLLTAGSRGQTTIAGPRWNGSLFTDTMLKGLRKEVDPYHNKIVTTRALYVWLLDAVPKEAQKAEHQLTPLFVDLNRTGSVGDFLFVKQ
jgi:hypothetical protein